MPNNFNYDGFQGINSVAIRRGDRCQIYNHEMLEYRNETDIDGLRCNLNINPQNLIIYGLDDYIIPKSMFRPNGIIPNFNHYILYLFQRPDHVGDGRVFNFFNDNVCYNLTSCNVFTPGSALLFVAQLTNSHCMCLSESDGCTGNTVCWNNRGWAEDLSHFGLSTVKSVSIMNSPDQCNNYHMIKVDKSRVDNMASAC
ncbi:hypothetical protein WR25_09903 [Diploscapter pachys]|uniref:Uncharacterized protein n=1 Tax=Diploscapter pachys TaxID=2018661 RepID=A0A2A2JC98_9BILA|nr:hypothetical protein WR25_09903 [Diploscapter pachys]